MSAAQAQTWFRLALALEDAGRLDEALEHYDRALGAEPGFADALHNRGLLLWRMGRQEEAELGYRGYVEAHPGSARALSALADVRLALDRYDGALEALDALLKIAPADASAQLRRGVALSCLRRFAEAREIPGIAAVLSPENVFIARRYMRQARCDWSGWDDYVAELRKAARDPGVVLEPAVAYMALLAPLSGVERHAIARGIAARIEATTPVLPPPQPHRRRRIRVGVLSPDLREHVTGHALLPLFELLDRERFEVHAYSLTADDGSATAAGIRAAADGLRELQPVTDHEAALAIRQDDIDILIDAAGHTTGGRFAIVARRPARVQAQYLGFFGSLGSKRVDYAIVDRIVAPSSAEWSEALVYLPDSFHLYDFRPVPPAGAVSRSDYGLPDDAFVFCAFHRADKVTPDSFALWMEILERVPRSVLWMQAPPAAAIARLRSLAAARGVDPARLVFVPFEPRHGERYLPRQRLGDLLLDALHHNAMTTACDALGVGLPVLTLRGSAPATRSGESQLRGAGLPELVAADRGAFVEIAVRLAANGTELRAYRERLIRRSASLFDTAGRVRELEAAFEQMIYPCDE